MPNLYIGSKHACFNIEALHSYNILSILNISGIPPTYPKDFNYLTIEMHDKEDSNLLSVLPFAMLFIDNALKKGGCLVHCVAGRSRSAAIIIAYLIYCFHYSFNEAYDYVKSKRSVVTLNKGFQSQLKAYFEANCDVYLANQIVLNEKLTYLNNLYNSIIFILLETRLQFPTIQDPIRTQLVIPSSSTTVIIPNLRGLQMGYNCRYCDTILFIATKY